MHGERLHFDLITATAKDSGGADCMGQPNAGWVEVHLVHIDKCSTRPLPIDYAKSAAPDTAGPDVKFDWSNKP